MRMRAFPSFPHAGGAGILLVLSVAAAVLPACSVKEDRRGCPCLLRLDFSETSEPERPERLLLSAVSDDGFSLAETLEMSEVRDIHEIRVPRSGVRLNLWSDDAGDYVGKDGLAIPFGDDCPPVLMYSASVETSGETCTEKVVLHKNYCRLTVIADGEDGYPFNFGVLGNVDGYGADGHPHRGAFFHYLIPEAAHSGDGITAGEAGRVMLLPRQTDQSLVLEVMEGTEILKTFALGNYIVQSGYDWTSPDLEDIAVRIDYASTRITIEVGAWEYSYDVDIEF